ncbi:hypothetical protein ABZ714_21515 [Streptomyces sp. NPDC006798]|uniref:hypothetical protein n=1 Tax=Streptomyces sp. NPDC006798 TaxID=3155462 RepID=UPI0034082EB5
MESDFASEWRQLKADALARRTAAGEGDCDDGDGSPSGMPAPDGGPSSASTAETPPARGPLSVPHVQDVQGHGRVAPEDVRVRAEAELRHFRRQRVRVPLDEAGGPLTVAFGGIDWICAFTDETALAAFHRARGSGEPGLPVSRVPGAYLLDEVIPAAGFPCGVAVDAAGPEVRMYPPLRGIVPDRAALDRGVAPPGL